jgi:hypothetical protein
MLDSPRDADVSAQPAEILASTGLRGDGGQRFAFLDALRGLGALGIVCYHVHRYRPLEIPADSLLPNMIQFVVRHGWISVQVFWVIAGFVLAYSLRKTVVRPASFGNFTLRRFLRLGMPYWTALLVVVVLDSLTRRWAQLLPLVDDSVTLPHLAANFAFLQDVLHYGNISAGTWFVCVDLQFGLLFIVMLWIVQVLSWPLPGKAGRANIDAFILASVFVPLGLVALFWFNIDLNDYSAWAIYYFHMPLFGAMAWWALEGRIPRAVFWAYAAALAGGAAYRWQLGLEYQKPLDIIVTLTAGVVVYLVGRYNHLGDWLAARPLQYLGRISYSLFLIHYPTSWLVVSAGCHRTGNNATAAVLWMALAVVASIGAAHLMYMYVEAPSLRLVKRLSSS